MANNPKKHKKVKFHTRYKLKDGTLIPGITTITGQKVDRRLIKWANNLGKEGIDSDKYVDELGSIGSLAHDYVQAKFAGKELDESEYTPKQRECASVCIGKFKELVKQRNFKTVLVETPLVSEVHKYGGTLDWYGIMDGKKTLLDWKTGSGFYEEHKMQLSANKTLLEEHGHVVEKCLLIGIGRNSWESTHIEDVGAMDDRFKKFLNLLEIYNINKKLKV